VELVQFYLLACCDDLVLECGLFEDQQKRCT